MANIIHILLPSPSCSTKAVWRTFPPRLAIARAHRHSNRSTSQRRIYHRYLVANPRRPHWIERALRMRFTVRNLVQSFSFSSPANVDVESSRACRSGCGDEWWSDREGGFVVAQFMVTGRIAVHWFSPLCLDRLLKESVAIHVLVCKRDCSWREEALGRWTLRGASV